MSHANPAAHFDELDPHGSEKHAHHALVGPFQLRLVLVVLLFFTAATVGFAQLEVFIEGIIGTSLPWWVNVAGAMSIAVIKSLLVMAIFMQLRYDNPMNSIIMCFTFAALAVFITFTGIDLFGRSLIDTYKGPSITAGGTDKLVEKGREKMKAQLVDKYGAEKGAEMYAELDEEFSHGHEGHAKPDGNTPSFTRLRTGLSGALSASAPAAHGHGAHAGHEGTPKGEHETTPGEKPADMGQESEGP
ncbi:MAG: cytochrome C oxidase subunit IV family protein [Phycisphaerales bacterium]|jgi:caa(3)-type oxidase subunit IV